MRFRHALAAWCAALLLSATSASAGQTVGTATGSIVGTARDATGSVLLQVGITVSGVTLMEPRRTATNAAGEYRLAALPPGDYTLSFSLQGFAPVEHAVRVSLNVTTTLDVTLAVAGQREAVAVASRSGALDRHSAAAADTFDARQLADLPSSRSLPGLLSVTHGLSVPGIEIGGSTGVFEGNYNAYGRNSSPRHTIEGIVVTGLFGAGFTLDYGSFEEASVLTAAHGAEWPTAGIHTQFVTKSGANQYRGTFFGGFENRRWQSANVDGDQIARFAPSGGGLSAREANQVWQYHDVNADAGGFVVRDRLWWYGSVRKQAIASRLITFPVQPRLTRLTNVGGKVTYRVGTGHTLVAYGQRGQNHQPHGLDPFGPGGSDLSNATAINLTADSTADQHNASWVWKGEWSSVVGDSLVFEVRAGQFGNDQRWTPRTAAPRFEDIDTLLVSGGNRDWRREGQRNQFFGSLSHFRDGWFGSHHFKVGGEVLQFLVTESWFSGYPNDVVHALQSGQPSSVFLFETPSQSKVGVASYAVYVSDSWRLVDRLTLNLGLRFDRYRLFLPAQAHPAGNAVTEFAAVDNLVDWNMVVPRIAAVYDLTGGGRTLAKAAYSRYRVGPNAGVAFNSNPNSSEWWSQHLWADTDGSGVWEPGEEGRRLRRRGGAAVESLDPALRLPVVDEIAAWVEHEPWDRIGLRTGLVWRQEREHFARQNANQPFAAFTVPVSLRDPGADGIAGTPDDGADVEAYDLAPEFVGQAPANVVRNVPGSRSEYWTWEIGATRRLGGRWSFGAGFTHTWNRDQASGYLNQGVRNGTYPVTPNDLIHADPGGRHVFTTWTAKAHGTYEAPYGVRLSPVLRHQSGQPFGRTFTTDSSQLRYATVTVLAEPVGTRRMDSTTVVDVRVEKRVRLNGSQTLGVFLDVFNALNTNAEQNAIWSSGSSFGQPLTIVSPRIAMMGVKFDW